jgi:hypothetical protein
MPGAAKSALTVEQYDNALNRVRAGLGLPLAPLPMKPSAWRFLLERPEDARAWIERHGGSDNTKKGYYTAAMSRLHAFNRVEDAVAVAQARRVIEPAFRKHKERIVAAAAKQELTVREQARAITWPEVEQVREALRAKRNESVTDMQDWVILCLYTMQPPRRLDYTPMEVLQREPRAPAPGLNYLVLRATSGDFLMRFYKTAHTMGEQRVPVPPPLLSVLHEWRAVNTSRFLLARPDGGPMTEKQLSARIAAIFQRVVHKGVTNSMLRKAYVSWQRRGELSLAAKAELARGLQHTVGVEELHYFRPELAKTPAAPYRAPAPEPEGDTPPTARG